MQDVNKEVKTYDLPSGYNNGQVMMEYYKSLSSYCKELDVNYNVASTYMSDLEKKLLTKNNLPDCWSIPENLLYKRIISTAFQETKEYLNKSYGKQLRFF